MWRAAIVMTISGMVMALAGPYAVALEGYVPQSGGDVAFLEHCLVANGSVINGTALFRSINFPSYWFNANTRELYGALDFAVNDSLVAVFGDTLTLRGNFGAGTGNKLYGVYSLPARASQATIYSVDRYGTIGLYVDNRTVFLRPGQEYAYQEKETLKDGNATVRLNYDHRYVNRGLISKSAISSRMVS